jgi:biopolymer transport protein ExbD
MKVLINIVLIFLAICICHLSFGQKAISVNKEFGDATEYVKLKDTTIYIVITQTEDTFYFGSDKKARIKESETNASNSFRTTNKSPKILFNSNGTLLMTFDLGILKKQNDTIPVFNSLGQTVRHRIYKFYTCNIQELQINNYEKIRQHTYYKKLLNKILDYKTQ